MTMPAMCLSQDGPCPDPGNGVARYDGTGWTRYGKADGLLDTDVRVHLGPDGGVWATYARLPGAVSRFDGTRWTTQAAAPAGSTAIAVAPDGRLWLAGEDDLFATDGKAVLHLGMPAAPTPAPQRLVLEPTGQEGSSDGPTGAISWREYAPPTGHSYLMPAASAHGPVAIDGSALRWSTDGGVTWEATALPFEGWRAMADGDDLVVYGDGAIRLAWRNGRWVETESLVFEPAPVSVQAMAFGPRGARRRRRGVHLLLARTGSRSGVRRGSRRGDGPTGGVPGDEGIQGGCGAPGRRELAGHGVHRAGARDGGRFRRVHCGRPGRLERHARLPSARLDLDRRRRLDARVDVDSLRRPRVGRPDRRPRRSVRRGRRTWRDGSGLGLRRRARVAAAPDRRGRAAGPSPRTRAAGCSPRSRRRTRCGPRATGPHGIAARGPGTHAASSRR